MRDRKPADCLWCIAAQPQVYGSGVLWERIYKANRKKVRKADLIHPGQTLLIPPPEGPITQPPAPAPVTEEEDSTPSEDNSENESGTESDSEDNSENEE